MQYETVIGLEVHAQLLTGTKMFCGCSTRFGSGPNTQTCPICIGMPGVLPVMNKKAVEYVIRTGIAVDCRISSYSRFARKNYFYPDLPKGYQISQYELPLCEGGFVEIPDSGSTKKIGLTRIHLEEDAGKNIHGGANLSFVDLNRTGVPLMEIVSEPDIRTPKQAMEFMKKIRTILRYINVCDGNMEQGSLRCDANVSVRPVGQREFGTKTEMKNMNSFKFVEKALDYEIKRQIKMLADGGKIVQETRLWNAERGITESMRSKEEAHDYRYFPEPDLAPVEVEASWIEKIKADINELQDVKKARFISQFGLPEHDAELLTSERSVAEWFEQAVSLGGNPKNVSNWMMGDLMRLLNEENIPIQNCPLKPAHLVDLLKLIEDGTINRNQAKSVFVEIYKRGKVIQAAKGKMNLPALKIEVYSEVKVIDIVKEKGLAQISDESEIEAAINDILEKNPGEVERFKAGEAKLMGFFVGQAMKATKGKANPKIVNELLRKKLG
ncbi:MAG TPA: Asp-tRNA(Asn)/Glu-tRNA(Gln) amidotransferase subunit GatB [Nitrospirae bacterium]|nr:aspartyl/glutamyl-tRNA(Asn/Gln) amidotransferase subunit B [bacterium BMS3Abin10]GBE37905.1 aspartyl/glutamyl-tRNA(Asn/Gln) amidotransferase subunit B [bacterium BMS3Bbin08]HDH50929.1 Asp-tRNA(Asn)/Glu-tRNA(Gln) amidotransferase subunit GatB [Nitrospirota bacterium]HDK80976.1 Asp-tRNA(Asn)/Glu-tRNA(Gln) amidotransferase subunit GatB [Nitrospirota bacterium]